MAQPRATTLGVGRFLRWPVLLRTIAVADLALAATYIVTFIVLVARGLTRGADFTAFYTGWRIVLDGRGAQLYDPAVQAEVQRTILGGQSFEAGLNPFNNPPHLVLPFAPLGLLPLDAAFIAWTAIQFLLVALLLRLLLGQAAGWSRPERLALAGWVIAAPPLAITVFQGAFSLVLSVAVVAAFAAVASGRNRSAGIWLVLASVKPQAVAGAAVAMLAARRWATVLSGLAAGGVLAVAATLVLGPAIWTSYLSFLGDYMSTFDRYSVVPGVMWNLRGTLTLVLGRDHASTINLVASAGFVVGMAAVGWLWRRWPTGPRAAADLALRFALTILLTLLFAPHLNPHDDLLLVVALVLAVSALRGSRAGRWLAIAAGAIPFAIVAGNGLAADGQTTLAIRVPTLILVTVAALLAVALRRGWATRTDPDRTDVAADPLAPALTGSLAA